MLSLLAETQMFIVLALWPIPREVIAARWLDRLRSGSCLSLEVKDNRRGTDQTWMFESSDPVTRCNWLATAHDTGWRCAGGVEICLPVQTYEISRQFFGTQ